ncbi:hypothetical protein Tco_0464455 [Tanacetum coccineum]
MPTEMELTLEQTQQGVSYEVSVNEARGAKDTLGILFWGFDESDTYVLERFDTSAGNPVKEILLKLNLPDHRILKYGGEERYGHVGLNIASLQDGETRLCLVDDLKVFKITISHSRQDKGTSSSLKSMITTSNHKLMIEVKDYELKTKVEA